MLIFEVEEMIMCLISSLGIINLLSSLLEEKVLILKAFLLERKVDLRESLDGRLSSLGRRPWWEKDLGRRFGGLGRRVDKRLKMRG